MEITTKLILKMGTEARIEIESFALDTFATLLKKYRGLRDSNDFIEQTVSKQLNEQIEATIKSHETAKHHKELLELMLRTFIKRKVED